ncbi:MAG: hypothetical protein P9M14_10725 [Candidatus Alcyoniella australis]|nr:hypothetical protein [Candidatus Alcyoniella australis]
MKTRTLTVLICVLALMLAAGLVFVACGSDDDDDDGRTTDDDSDNDDDDTDDDDSDDDDVDDDDDDIDDDDDDDDDDEAACADAQYKVYGDCNGDTLIDDPDSAEFLALCPDDEPVAGFMDQCYPQYADNCQQLICCGYFLSPGFYLSMAMEPVCNVLGPPPY